jgi:hypothetical protein
MELKDLRIGNKIHGIVEDETIECTVLAIDSVGVAEQSIWVETVNSEHEYFDEFKPILLTEDWLVKFGFKREVGWDGFIFYAKDQVEIYITTDDKFLNELDTEVKHVHQLQNLFHSLTGKELI